jgi:site-specific DNA-methyltransferase (adenine-specific)
MNRVLFSSASDHWSTPNSVRLPLVTEFNLNFDPCTLLSADDGIKLKWEGRVFCNPPYSKIEEFIKKGLWHLSEGDCSLLVFLIPARTDTKWFHEYCLKATEIRFIRGRLKFGNAKTSAPFPSMVVIFNEWTLARYAF